MAITDSTQFGRMGAFRFWCQKVLPAVYDDSLSYYELLCKVVKYLNDLIAVSNTQSDAITELQETLAQFMEGEFDSYIEEKVDEWFEENEPDIVNDIEQLGNDIDDTYDYFNNYIKNLSWNCNFRTIVRDCYDTSKTYSVQGFTHFIQNGVEYIAQTYDLDGDAVLVVYDYNSMTEIDRITGNYGHLNDVSYRENTIYCLDVTTQYVHMFEYVNSTLSYNGYIVMSDAAAGIAYTDTNIWYCIQSASTIYIFKCDNSFNIKETFTIPNTEQTYIQGISVCNDKIAIAATVPNSIIIYDIKMNDYYFIGLPVSVGHCFIDEVEGISLLENGDLLFNTNTAVDLQVICSIFKTNLKHNVQKETETCIRYTRYNQIQVTIDSVNGSLTNPIEVGSFKLVGDAINYAKNMGNPELVLNFVNDYPYPIVANNANINMVINDPSIKINLHGLVLRYSKVIVSNISRFILHPTNIPILVDGNSIIYGGYAIECIFDIPVGTWGNLESPEVYDATHKKIFFVDSIVKIQDITYYRYNNCILMSATSSESTTSIYNRTGFVVHSS